MTWAAKYIGKPWTEKTDCAYWFCRIQREVFGRDVPGINADHSRLAMSACRIFADPSVLEAFGVAPTDAPADGDAVFMSQRNRPHHIGTVVIDRPGEVAVLHALEGVGVVLSDLLTLRANHWKIAGFWTWR